MKMIVLALFDVKVAAFQRPAFAPTVAAFVRAVGDEARRAGSELSAHPDDYQLFRLGEFDDANGLIVPVTPPELVCQVSSLIDRK